MREMGGERREELSGRNIIMYHWERSQGTSNIPVLLQGILYGGSWSRWSWEGGWGLTWEGFEEAGRELVVLGVESWELKSGGLLPAFKGDWLVWGSQLIAASHLVCLTSLPGLPCVAQTVKNLPAMWETRVRSLGWEDPLEKGMATHSSILAWRIPWTEEPGGLQSLGSQRAR